MFPSHSEPNSNAASRSDDERLDHDNTESKPPVPATAADLQIFSVPPLVKRGTLAEVVQLLARAAYRAVQELPGVQMVRAIGTLSTLAAPVASREERVIRALIDLLPDLAIIGDKQLNSKAMHVRKYAKPTVPRTLTAKDQIAHRARLAGGLEVAVDIDKFTKMFPALPTEKVRMQTKAKPSRLRIILSALHRALKWAPLAELDPAETQVVRTLELLADFYQRRYDVEKKLKQSAEKNAGDTSGKATVSAQVHPPSTSADQDAILLEALKQIGDHLEMLRSKSTSTEAKRETTGQDHLPLA